MSIDQCYNIFVTGPCRMWRCSVAHFLFICVYVHVCCRWDRPRLIGSRRRRIMREKDLPDAPPDPPPSGYVVFVSQMTTKIRHDRPSVQHNQSKGTCWFSVLSIPFQKRGLG